MGRDARSMRLKANLLAFFDLFEWFDGDGVILECINQFPVILVHNRHYFERVFLNLGDHELIHGLYHLDGFRDPGLLLLFHGNWLSTA